MGGQAFAHHVPPLKTPRMPVHIYKLMRDSILNILLRLFTDVKSPLEAPGKPDHGDIDILVHGPLAPEFDPTKTEKKKVAEIIASKISSQTWIVGKNAQPMNFAIHWPKRKMLQVHDDGSTTEMEIDDHAGVYIQVDVHICKDFKAFKWEYFHSAHGDLWNILGTTIRIFGLTVNDRGMVLRIPEIEQGDKKRSMVFLTDEPSEILQFLGLNEIGWFKEFGTKEEMFQYAAGCRMFWVRPDLAYEDGDMYGDVVGDIDDGKKKLRHNDRQRMSKRPTFKEWIEDFIPRCRDEGKYCNLKVTREQIRDEAFIRFGIKEEWDTRLREWKLEKHNDQLWRDVIKGNVPDDLSPQQRAATIRELKDIIMNGQEFQGSIPEAAVTDADGYHDFEKVRDFIKKNLQTVGDVGLKKQLERATERMRDVQLIRQNNIEAQP